MKPTVSCAVCITALTTALAFSQIPDGFELEQITADSYYDVGISINECGQIVFTKRLGNSWSAAEIFLYDNGKTTRVTQNADRETGPDINNLGEIVWARGMGEDGVTQIILYVSGSEYLVAQNPRAATSPAINDASEIVWDEWWDTGCERSDADVLKLGTEHPVRISDGTNTNQSPQINSLGSTVWTDYDFCPDPWESMIWLYDGASSQVISDERMSQPQVPANNETGQIVWMATEARNMLWKWENGIAERLTDWGSNPRINSRGDVVFYRWDDSIRRPHTWLYRDGEFLQLTTGPYKYWVPDINEYSEVTIRMDYSTFSSDVLFMRRMRTGEADFDGDIDLTDYRKFADCLSGVDFLDRNRVYPTDTLCECRFLDIDHDNDVDLADWAKFQNAFAP